MTFEISPNNSGDHHLWSAVSRNSPQSYDEGEYWLYGLKGLGSEPTHLLETMSALFPEVAIMVDDRVAGDFEFTPSTPASM